MDKITCSKTGKRWQVYLAHVPKTITHGERTFLSIRFRCLPPRPKQSWWQKNISSRSFFRAEQEPLKKENKTAWWQLVKTIPWQLPPLSIYKLYLNQEAWCCPDLGFSVKGFLKRHTYETENVYRQIKVLPRLSRWSVWCFSPFCYYASLHYISLEDK